MQKNPFVFKIKQKGFLRAVALFLTVCLLFSGMPVSAAAASEDEDHGYVDLDAKSVTFKKGKVLLKEKDFSITTKDIYTRDNGFIIVEVTIQNMGKKSLDFWTDYCVINGYNVYTSLYATVRAGNKANVTMSIDALPLVAAGETQLKELEVYFEVRDESTNKPLYEDCAITVPLGVPVDMDYYPYEKCIYEEDAFRLTLLGSMLVNRRSSPSLIFKLENHLDGSIFARNDGNLSVNNQEFNFYAHATAEAYTDAVFVLTSGDKFFEEIKGNTATMDFPLSICTSNYNPIVDTRIKVGITREGKIRQFNFAAQKSKMYESSMGEFGPLGPEPGQSTNMFAGMFANYKPDSRYISSLRKKYPDNYERYSERAFLPYVNELLTLYLDDLDQAGYDFGIMERTDMCTETCYVVELTDGGKSAIQIAFTQVGHDPKAAYIMTLGCESENYKNLDKLNRYIEVMWMAYDTLNVHMTEQKHANLILNSQTMNDEEYGVMMRGQYDGLGYVQSTNEKNVYLTISPDLTLPIFKGLK